MKTILLLGATGAVGGEFLKLALEHPRVGRIVAPSRKALPFHAKLENPIVDFAHLPEDAPWWKSDVAVCALGSTIAQAGSKEAFFKIDHNYVLNAATLILQAKTPCFIYNSSMGAHATSRSFYLATKGKIEQSLNALSFASTYHFRPSLLIASNRPKFRFGESCMALFLKFFDRLIPQSYKAISVENVARAMLIEALNPKAGVHIINSGEIQRS